MDDEEAKRIQEERDKELTEEYKELQNPKNPDYNKIINEAFPEPKPKPNTQYPHRPDYVGPSNLGKTVRDPVGDVVTAGLAYGTSRAINPLLKIIGPAGAIDATINTITGESDTPFEKKLEIFRPAKVAVKGYRLAEKLLTDVFDKRVSPDYYTKGPLDTLKTATTGGLDVGTARDVGGPVFRGFGQNFVPPNPSEVNQITRKLLNEHVLVGPNRIFDYGAFRALFTGNKRGRLLEGWMQTTPHFKIANWNTHRQELVDVFESIYGDVMQLKNISRKRIQIDHLVTLRSSMPVYDGVAFGSPLWNRIQETFLRRPNRYNPGNTLDNLDALDPGSHTVKTNFFNKRIGKDGELFFTPEKLEYMKASEANRMEVLNDFLDIQDEGTLILREAKTVWEELYKIDNTEMPLDIYNRLSSLPIGEFTHPELENLDELKSIITDIITDETARASEGLKDLSKVVKEGVDLEDYSTGVRQVQQDTDPSELLPKPRRVISKKGKLQKELTKDPDQTDLGI